MSQTTIEKLTQRLRAAEGEFEAIDPKITHALANESPEADVARLRIRRRELVEQCDDLAEAIRFAEGRQTDAKRKEADERQSALRRDARQKAAAFVTAAGEVDDVLAKLEEAFSKFNLMRLDLSRALRLAGLGDDARIANSVSPALRWASWRSAPAFSEQSQIPRAEVQRRKPMRDSASRLIPHIPT